jgi:hypothetical protein
MLINIILGILRDVLNSAQVSEFLDNKKLFLVCATLEIYRKSEGFNWYFFIR